MNDFQIQQGEVWWWGDAEICMCIYVYIDLLMCITAERVKAACDN
jgi:hypothetical protein